MDPPVCGDIVKTPSNRGVAQPVVVFSPEDASSTVYTHFDLVATTNQGPYRVGKNEAHVACTRLLGAVPLGSSIDVTNSVGFPWRRFLKTQSVGRNLIGPGLWRVCVAPRVRGASLAFFALMGTRTSSPRVKRVLCLPTRSCLRRRRENTLLLIARRCLE